MQLFAFVFIFAGLFLHVKGSPIHGINNGSELVAHISNGLAWSVPYKVNNKYSDFVVNGSLSHDTNFPELKTQDLSFNWRCRVISPESQVSKSIAARLRGNTNFYDHTLCLSRELTEGLAQIPILSFNSEMFLENITYQFELAVSKGERQATTVQELKVGIADPPVGIITCVNNCLQKINIKAKTRFSYNCIACDRSKLEAKWSIFSRIEPVWTNESKILTTYSDLDLNILPNAFKEASIYTIRLDIGYKGNMEKSTYSLNITTSSTPYGGNCVINPKNGSDATKFHVQCQNWKTEDRNLSYGLLYVRPSEGSVFETISKSNLYINSGNFQENTSITFPYGNETDNYSLQIIIRIYNSFGQYEELSGPDLKIQVKPMNLNLTRTLNTTNEALSGNDVAGEDFEDGKDMVVQTSDTTMEVYNHGSVNNTETIF